MTLSRKRVLLIVVASIATVGLIAVGLVRAGVLGGHKATAAASASAHGNAAKVTEPSDRFIISYAENSAAGKVIAPAKAYGENVLNSLPAKDKEALTAAAGKFSVKLESVTAHAMSTAAVKLSDKLTVDQVKEFISTLEAAHGIEAVEPDLHVTALGNTSAQDSNVPNDPYFSEQWDMTSGSYGINATNAWSQSTGKGITVAVIDNGVLTDHPDLEGQLLPGYDFISDAKRARDNDGYDADPYDEGDWNEPGECPAPNGADRGRPSSWHGSHVAGTIAAHTNNGDGVAGVAPDAKIVPVRALGRCGGESANIVDAITWASGGKVNGAPANKNPAQILNLSVGGARVCPRFYQKAINAAVERGSIVVAAAGNNNEDARNAAPASCENVITVGATTSTGTRSSFSNYESQTAPRSIGYSDMVGTSQAAPHVSGTIALMLAANPDLKTAEIVSILQNTATPLSKCDQKSCGAGIVNAASAVAEASSKSAKPGNKPSAKPSATAGGRTLRLGN